MTALLSEPLRCHWRKEAEAEEGSGERQHRLAAAARLGRLLAFLPARRPRAPRGSVLFLHGMSEHSGMYLHVIRALADAGFAVVAPDQRGQGPVRERPLAPGGPALGRARPGGHRRAARPQPGRARRASPFRRRHQHGVHHRAEVCAGAAGRPCGHRPRGAAVRHSAGDAAPAAGRLLADGRAGAAPGNAAGPAIPHISRVRAFQNELDWDPWCYHGPLRARAGRQLVKALVEIERARPS